ncbi:MAG: YbjN domain-containing protein [Acidimicrobiales bacterium]|nr:YbjN domain-containing protein [Acidimicrobiales bacterium]
MAGDTAGTADPAADWDDLERRLAGVVAAMAAGERVLLLTVDAPYFLGLTAAADGGVCAEAVSNQQLHPRRWLSPRALERLDELGWTPPSLTPDEVDEPGHDPAASQYHRRAWAAPVPPSEVAAVVAATLRDVFGVTAPAGLAYAASADDGRDRALPALGLVAYRADEGPEVEVFAGLTPDELRRHVIDTVGTVTESGAAQVDADGDIPLRNGTAVTFVRVLEDPLRVRLFSPLLTDVPSATAALEAVNDWNRRLPFGFLLVADTQILLVADLVGDPFVPSQLLEALMVITELADVLDEQLQELLGGRLFLVHDEPKPRWEPTPGYL